ncbi:MAG: peptidylprolyl isomerase [Gemmatimonas sp.]
MPMLLPFLLVIAHAVQVAQPELKRAPSTPQSVVFASPQQAAIERQLLEVEHTRAQNVAPIATAIATNDARLQQLAARTAGRLERPELANMILPLFKSTNVGVRRETASALGQMQAKVNYADLLQVEKSGSVRGELFATVGRVLPSIAGAEQLLLAGLDDPTSEARTGAIRGLESLFRLTRGQRPAPATQEKLRAAFVANTGDIPRQLLLLTLNAANAGDSATYAIALKDSSAQVRRLAVAGSKQWTGDVAPMVRYQALRTANNCARAEEALGDANEGVALAAIDMIGDKKCPTATIEKLVTSGSTWRLQAHSLVALSKTAPTVARANLNTLANHKVWQARVYAATAAKTLGDSATLAKLARDPEPNVAIEAMTSSADAIRALGGTHSGLVRAGALKLKGSPALPGAVPQILATLDRLSKNRSATNRDPRIALLDRLSEAADSATAAKLRPYLSDIDPAVAKIAATILSQKTKTTVVPVTTTLLNLPLPSAATINGLKGATARITMKGMGVITLELLTEEAPVTVANFVDLAEKGKMNGLTFHRIVANFVIQGGSPGADEYDGITQQFMKDEVGLPSHLRGTLGISTRGHDTGDGQIFVNLIDNYRLDHQYTVFARITSGMDVVDRVQEGDTMESVQIFRRR